MKKLKYSLLFCAAVVGSSISYSALLAKSQVNLLFVGKTGSGKSATINTIYNVVEGRTGSPEDYGFVIPLLHFANPIKVNVDEYKENAPKLSGVGRSQTYDIRKYTAENSDYEVNMYDVPGFIDTSGNPQTDRDNCMKIMEKLSNVDVHGVVIVMKSSDPNRTTFEYKSWVSLMKNTFTKSMMKHIFGIMTYTDVRTEESKNNLSDIFTEIVGEKRPIFQIDNLPLFINSTNDQLSLLLSEIKWKGNIEEVEALLEKAKGSEL